MTPNFGTMCPFEAADFPVGWVWCALQAFSSLKKGTCINYPCLLMNRGSLDEGGRLSCPRWFPYPRRVFVCLISWMSCPFQVIILLVNGKQIWTCLSSFSGEKCFAYCGQCPPSRFCVPETLPYCLVWFWVHLHLLFSGGLRLLRLFENSLSISHSFSWVLHRLFI